MDELSMDKVNKASTDVPEDIPADLDPQTLLKLLLDEERLALLGLVAQQPHTIAELVAMLPRRRTPPAKHVSQLVAAGLLAQVDGDCYTLNVRQIQSWKRTLFTRPVLPIAQSPDEQILATFIRNGKMMQYPAHPSKRLVVLRWLAGHFEPGRDYTEREVNEILAGHSEDHATLRRYLVDFEMLVRQRGIYQRASEPATTGAIPT